MTISFRNTVRDRLAFAAYHLPRHPLLLLIAVGFFLWINFTSFVPAFKEMPADKPMVVRFIAFILAELLLVCFIVALIGVIVLLAMISRRNKPLFCQKTITLGEEAFVGESEYGRSEIRWTTVQKLARTRRHIFIYLGQDNAVVIPRRAFESNTQWDAFYEYCLEKTKRAYKVTGANRRPAGQPGGSGIYPPRKN
ncbi:MAG: YcxB family protein [Verrucomicrobiae bacterium]|nr:YcxB family protein [Verrucomicrobiae bacterium]